MDESRMDESHMDPSLRQPSARTPRRRPYRPVAFLLFVLLFVLLVAMLGTVTLRQSLAGASTPASRGNTTSVVRDAPSSTPTPSAPFTFLDQALKTTTSLRGSYAFLYTDSSADGSVLYVIVELPAPPTLADAQWDAFVIQQLAWSTPDAQPHTGWEIAVSFHVLDGACSSCVGQWGTHVGMADLKAATAVRLMWARLTPEQAWQRYDGTLFDPSGLHP